MARKGYVQLVNSFYMNWKVRKLREECPNALGVFTMVLSYCGDNLSDGEISSNDLKYVIGASHEEITALCAVEMLIMSEDGTKYTVHDYLRHNRSNEQVTKKRVANSENYRRKTDASDEKTRETSDMPPLFESESEVSTPKEVKTSDSDGKNESESGQTPEHQNTRTLDIISPPTPSRPDFDALVEQAEACWPTNRFDGRTSQTRMQLEIEWPKIVKAAGAMDPVGFFLGKCRAYCESTEEQYVKTFSRFIGGELYARNWRKQPPRAGSQALKSRSQENLEANLANTWKYMTEQERAEFQRKGGVYGTQQG